jgi:hypothetical protein
MVRWTIQDQVSFPLLAWSTGLEFTTFGLDQLNNNLVQWVPHAEEIRGHRTTVLSLESRIIHLEDDVLTLSVALKNSNDQLARLQARRVVRLALAVAATVKPLLRVFRQS